ncbi:unnamed protein product, partial [Mesorhabditis belari]|uniref:Uncharacterized protein n=1 Tax=Mesorhabditis belari TaxID=2138241 RepID=A0AAF3FFU1_9BILA
MTTLLPRICRRGIASSRSYAKTTSDEAFEQRNQRGQEVTSGLIDAAFRIPSFSKIDTLAKYLQQNVILHEPGHFLIIPKPYGVSCLGMKQKGGGVFKNSVHDQIDDDEELEQSKKGNDITISDCLPLLAKHFQEPQLQFCTGLKRNVSGPIVLPANKTDFQHLLASLKRTSSKADDFEQHKALVLAIGQPDLPTKSLKGYTTFQKVGNHKEYVFVEAKADRRARTGKYAVQSQIAWEVLGTANGISLLDVSVWKFARHFPRVALSHLLCPILGDTMYMNRIIELDGKPALLDPRQLYRQKNPTWLPPDFLRITGISRSMVNRLPMMWHVYRTMYPNYGTSAEQLDLVASLDPPTYFVAMVEALGLSTHLTRHLQKYER